MNQNMPDKLPKKHLFIAVQAVNYEFHKTTNLHQDEIIRKVQNQYAV